MKKAKLFCEAGEPRLRPRGGPPSDQYSVIEISLCVQDSPRGSDVSRTRSRDRAKEKASARELLLSCRIPERSLAISDYKGVYVSAAIAVLRRKSGRFATAFARWEDGRSF